MRRWRSFSGPLIRSPSITPYQASPTCPPRHHWLLLLLVSTQRRLTICNTPIPATLYGHIQHTGAFGSRDRVFYAILHPAECLCRVLWGSTSRTLTHTLEPGLLRAPGTMIPPLLPTKHRARKGFIMRLRYTFYYSDKYL